MVNFNWVPGAGLLQQAWDATKLAQVIIAKRQEKAVVLAKEKRAAQLEKFKDGADANKKFRELFMEKKYEEVAKLFVPLPVVQAVKDANEVYWKIWDLYWIFALVRIALVFLPQTGYIHPDEYFQSVEVISGDVFHLDVNRTWEFNVTSPIRSMTLPLVLYGGPLFLYKGLNAIFFYHTGFNVVAPYLVYIIPRLVMLALSFVIDYSLYKICVLYKEHYNRCLTTLASSYVMLIYSTRTFSNTIEMVLVSLLMYLVAHCMKRSSETIYLQTLVQKAYDKAESVVEKVKLTKKRKAIPEHHFKHFLPISIICAIGFFNRPTFIAFALIPLFFWFQRGIATDSYWSPFQIFNFRMLSLVPAAVVTCLLLVLFDSLYYGEVTLRKLWELELEWSDWKCAPLNFIMYNVVPGNLAQHGSHPFYLHTLVNIPLLFGPLGIGAIITILSFVIDVFQYTWREKPGVRTVYALTVFTFAVSLGLLSIFPHQEPRFLIPLLLPCVLLSSHKLRFRILGHRPFLTLWYIFNIGMVLFYGFIHQAGVYPTLRYIGTELQFPGDVQEANFLFSNTYMPPKFPLFQGKRLNMDQLPYLTDTHRKIMVHDMAGAEIPLVNDKLVALASRARYLRELKTIHNYVILPSHLIGRLELESKGSLIFHKQLLIFPHVSTENLPAWDSDIVAIFMHNPLNAFWEILHCLSDFSLAMYRIELAGDVHTVEMETKRAKVS